jgi:hypothetical protein
MTPVIYNIHDSCHIVKKKFRFAKNSRSPDCRRRDASGISISPKAVAGVDIRLLRAWGSPFVRRFFLPRELKGGTRGSPGLAILYNRGTFACSFPVVSILPLDRQLRLKIQPEDLLCGNLFILDIDPRPELSFLRDGRYRFRA